jgi:hypothetical protein
MDSEIKEVIIILFNCSVVITLIILASIYFGEKFFNKDDNRKS